MPTAPLRGYGRVLGERPKLKRIPTGLCYHLEKFVSDVERAAVKRPYCIFTCCSCWSNNEKTRDDTYHRWAG